MASAYHAGTREARYIAAIAMRSTVFVAVLFGCGSHHQPLVPPNPPADASIADSAIDAPPIDAPPDAAPQHACGGAPLRIHFYNVAQALAALVDLPDGRHILVDTADLATREQCGKSCLEAHAHLVDMLQVDLHGAPIDMMWITHQHSDHVGGAIDLMEKFTVAQYVDNGRDLDAAEIKKTRTQAANKKIPVTAEGPTASAIPIADGPDLRLAAIVPVQWPNDCNVDRNQCSIALRVDYCSSSVLFAGDAETEEEGKLDPHGPVTLLQVGHHGSDTSSSAAFLAKVRPKYAVISAGKPNEGTNKTYCHPRASTVAALTTALGGPGTQAVRAFDAKTTCKRGSDSNWIDVPASDQLWATERDGDVVLVTTGNGEFKRE
jgi:competence protein ComEC